MDTLAQPTVSDPERLAGPRITPYFTAVLEAEAKRRGLPPEPWAA